MKHTEKIRFRQLSNPLKCAAVMGMIQFAILSIYLVFVLIGLVIFVLFALWGLVA